MKKTIGCFVHSPASANNIFAVLNMLQELFNVKIFTFHPHAQSLLQTNIMYEHNDLAALFEKYHFDVILTGTGSVHPVEQDVPMLAKKKGVPCISILDSFWLDDENLKYRFENKPDYITVPNGDVKQRIVNIVGMEESKVLNIGIPHLDRLQQFIKTDKQENASNVLGFFSTCSTSGDFSDTHSLAKKALLELSEWVERYPQFEKVLVTKHPREDGKWISEFCSRFPKFTFSSEPSWEVLLKSQISFGIPSSLLYEAKIIQKPSVIYQQEGDILNFTLPLVSEEVNYLSSFHASQSLVSFIQSLLNDKN